MWRNGIYDEKLKLTLTRVLKPRGQGRLHTRTGAQPSWLTGGPAGFTTSLSKAIKADKRTQMERRSNLGRSSITVFSGKLQEAELLIMIMYVNK